MSDGVISRLKRAISSLPGPRRSGAFISDGLGLYADEDGNFEVVLSSRETEAWATAHLTGLEAKEGVDVFIRAGRIEIDADKLAVRELDVKFDSTTEA